METPPRDQSDSDRPILNYSPPSPSKTGSNIGFFIFGLVVGIPTMVFLGLGIAIVGSQMGPVTNQAAPLWVVAVFGVIAVVCVFGMVKYIRPRNRSLFGAGFLLGMLLIALLYGACFLAMS